MEIGFEIDPDHEKFMKCKHFKISPPFSQNIGKTIMRRVRMDTGSNCAVNYIGKNGNYFYRDDGTYAEGFKHNFMILFHRKIDISSLWKESETDKYFSDGNTFPLKSYLKDEQNEYMYGLILPHDDIDTENGRPNPTSSFGLTQYTNSGAIRGLYNKEPDFIIGSHSSMVPKIPGTDDEDRDEQYMLFRERKLGNFYFSADTKEYSFKSNYSIVPDLLFKNFEDIQKTIIFRIRFLDLGRPIYKGLIGLYVPLEWDD